VDVKHLPKLRTEGGEWRKRFLFVAIDRRSRSVHLAVRDDETEASARAFLEEALAAFPFRVTRVLTDRGSCFTAEGFEKACRELGVEHRETRPLHAAHERDGRALQRPGPARGARASRWRPPRPGRLLAGSALPRGYDLDEIGRAPGSSRPRCWAVARLALRHVPGAGRGARADHAVRLVEAPHARIGEQRPVNLQPPHVRVAVTLDDPEPVRGDCEIQPT
jgi:hypothetical protein